MPSQVWKKLKGTKHTHKKTVYKGNTKQPTPIKIKCILGSEVGKRDQATTKIDSIVHLEKKNKNYHKTYKKNTQENSRMRNRHKPKYVYNSTELNSLISWEQWPPHETSSKPHLPQEKLNWAHIKLLFRRKKKANRNKNMKIQRKMTLKYFRNNVASSLEPTI